MSRNSKSPDTPQVITENVRKDSLCPPTSDNRDEPDARFTASIPDSPAHVQGHLHIRSLYGIHNRGCRLRVSGATELATVQFDTGDARMTLAFSGRNLVDFTRELVRFLTPEQWAEITPPGVTR